MRNTIISFLSIFYIPISLFSQNLEKSSWQVVAQDIDPANYYGVTVANGMVGIVSSPDPMHVQDVVLNGVYDYYQRGRVSNILKTFNHINMDLDINGHRISRQSIQNYAQTLDMKTATLTTTFDVEDEAEVKHQIMSLRHLPYSSLVNGRGNSQKGYYYNPHEHHRGSQPFK